MSVKSLPAKFQHVFVQLLCIMDEVLCELLPMGAHPDHIPTDFVSKLVDRMMAEKMSAESVRAQVRAEVLNNWQVQEPQ